MRCLELTEKGWCPKVPTQLNCITSTFGYQGIPIAIFSFFPVLLKLPKSVSHSYSTMKEIRRSAGGPSFDETTVPSQQDSTDVQFDTGLLAWTQVLVSHLLVVNGFGYLSSFGLFQSQWEETLDRSHADIAWVGSIQLFLLFFIGTLSGRAMDAGYFRSLILCGCSMQLIGVFTSSVVNKYWQLILSQGVLQGLGNGLLFTPLVALVSLHFVKRRTFALSIAACGAPVGGVIFSIVSNGHMKSLSSFSDHPRSLAN